VADWSPDGGSLLVLNQVSINEGYVWVVDVRTGAKELLSPKSTGPVAYGGAQFSRDGRAVLLTTDLDSEFQRLVRMDLRTRKIQALTGHLAWDVAEFDESPDGDLVALVTNEDGLGVLHLVDARTGKERKSPRLPAGVPTRLKWHPKGRHLAFNFTSARSPADVYSVDTKTGAVERWTESETGGVDPAGFVEPELVKLRSFDGLGVSGFLYRPDASKFPGKRPVMMVIHGGPESQSRPVFLARNNYFLNELGVALLYPNVRGSSGYGKTFLTLDNGFKREDSVKDIGEFLKWVAGQPGLDAERVCVYGGSYGGYMVLASLVHFGGQLRCGVDVVGISNFLTFLANTQDYRRDLRRVEYGDERDPAMRAHLESISPARQASRITKPLLVLQGANDPRVPASESGQMVEAIRGGGGRVWYVLAKDEGHGFQKRANVDYAFEAMVLFLNENLLAAGRD
jgi:dipeptidyl aminopeptidase/acylaminoacyl peptidase